MSEKFRTVYDRIRIISNPGSPMVDDYVSVYDEDGKRSLEKSGEHSIYDEIQAYRPNCELKTILARYVQTGDESLLQRRQAMYADVVDIPKTYADVLRLVNKANQIFETLPVEDRAVFHNNPDEFLASLGSETYKAVMAKHEEIIPEESEVKE